MARYTLKPGITALKWPKFAIDYFLTRPIHERTLSLEKPNDVGEIDEDSGRNCCYGSSPGWQKASSAGTDPH